MNTPDCKDATEAGAMASLLVRRLDRLIEAVERVIEAPDPIAYRMEEAARMVGVSRSMLYIAAKTGALPIRKYGRSSLIARSDLEDWLYSLPLRDLDELDGVEDQVTE